MSGGAGKLIHRPPANLKPKEWIGAVHVEMQDRIVSFLLAAYGFALAVTFVIFLLQGFHYRGFLLDARTLMWLGGATIGELAGLFALALRSVFRAR